MFRSRITIQRVTSTLDDAGGHIPVVLLQWSKWAKVENRTGNNFFDRGQREWEYSFKITTRFEKSRKEQSGDYIIYDGGLLQIKELSWQDEGHKRYVIYRCSTLDSDFINGLTALGIFTYVYTGTGGEFAFIANELNGKTVIAASKDGIEFVVYQKSVKATPEEKEVVYQDGGFEWSVHFEPGEKAIIHYY